MYCEHSSYIQLNAINRIKSDAKRAPYPTRYVQDKFYIMTPTNNNRFKDQLRRQLSFISASCTAFDPGVDEEGIRIAIAIRILIHNTKNSTSLLKHLGAKSTKLLSTIQPVEYEKSLTFYDGISLIYSAPQQCSIRPQLSSTGYNKDIPINEWLNQLLYVAEGKFILTRKDIILTAANKDGGAHVDADLKGGYKKWSEGVYFISRKNQDGSQQTFPFNKSHLLALRQMGYEILNSQELLLLLK